MYKKDVRLEARTALVIQDGSIAPVVEQPMLIHDRLLVGAGLTPLWLLFDFSLNE